MGQLACATEDSVGKTIRTLKEQHADDACVVFVARDDAELVGIHWLCMRRERSGTAVAHIQSLWVAQSHRRRGIARALKDHGEALALKSGATALLTDVHYTNTRVVELNVRRGFVGDSVPMKKPLAGKDIPAPPDLDWRIDHVQLAIPPDQEDRARAFWVGLLGFTEVDKPIALRDRGGAWFIRGALAIHVGIEQDFRPARKAHVALRVRDLDGLYRALLKAGVEASWDRALQPEFRRFFADDPFGNRLEFLASNFG